MRRLSQIRMLRCHKKTKTEMKVSILTRNLMQNCPWIRTQFWLKKTKTRMTWRVMMIQRRMKIMILTTIQTPTKTATKTRKLTLALRQIRKWLIQISRKTLMKMENLTIKKKMMILTCKTMQIRLFWRMSRLRRKRTTKMQKRIS